MVDSTVMQAGRYKAYPEYKDSGVEWLGEIPSGWGVISLKRKAKFITGKTPLTSIASYYSDYKTPYEWVRPEDIKEHSEDVEATKYLTKQGWDTQREVTKNSVLLCCIGTIGKAAYTSEPLTTNQQITAVIFNDISKYNYYLLVAARAELEDMATGNVVKILNSERLGTLSIPDLEIADAKKIANFLDHETAKIDTLIEKQQRLIELLTEKRQAVISHAVTKGLNPDVPMKDSGIEWLGEVPEHWDVKRLKYISPKIGVGLVINPSTYTQDEGLYFIFGGDVKQFGFDLTNTRRISKENSDKLKPSRLNHRDLVSVRVGYPGVTAVVPKELEGSNCASIIIIRRGQYNSDWLCSAMNAWVGMQQVNIASYGAAQKQFNVSDAIEFVFPYPPNEEQKKIAVYVEQQLDKFNLLISRAQQAIQLMQERRTALISAAVTGKIDVRDWVKPESNPNQIQ